MANASPRDVAIGYDYFWQKRGKLSREDVNRYLAGQRRSQISVRTFAHYRDLLSHGVRHYISINRFDVLSTLGMLNPVRDMSRDAREAVDIEAKVSHDGDQWLAARVVDRSRMNLGILINNRLPVTIGSLLLIRPEGYRDIPTVIVWQEFGEDFARIDVRAFRLVASYRDKQGESPTRGSGRLVIERHAEDKIPWTEFYSVLRTTNDLIEDATYLLRTLGDAFDTDLRVAEPVVQYISFGSPGGAELKLDFGVTDFIKLLLDKAQFWKSDGRIRAAEAERKELENTQLKRQMKVEQERSIIELAALKEDLTQKRLETIAKTWQVLGLGNTASTQASNSELVDSIAEQIKTNLPKILGIPVPAEKLLELFSLGTPERGLLSDHLLPAAARLSGGGDETFTVKVETDSGDNK